ncbi:thiolase family protein [Dehalococcoidia bacterium]|nr:thiolase family protein [Dehalococcoidia bacterium]
MPNGMYGRRVAVAGVGYSIFGRRTGFSMQTLTAMAFKAALDDAGLLPQEIDGVATYGPTFQLMSAMKASTLIGVPRLKLDVCSVEGPTFMGGAIPALAAVASGTCDVAVAFRAMLGDGGSYSKRAPSPSYGGDEQFTIPFGATAGPHWVSQYMRRHMELYGTKEEHWGAQALAQREFASLNENAFFRDPLTIDDYLSSRYICKPCRLLDCDYPIDGAGAIIFTTEDRARNLKQKPVFVDSWATASGPTPDSYLMEDMTRPGMFIAAEEMWNHTSLKPKDIQVAGLYDGFIFSAVQWLEALGFCGQGEGGPFVAEGHTRPGGSIPSNCDGGAVNAGRTHGANHIIEVIHQLRGESGDRQVPHARVGVATSSLGPGGGVMLLTTD